MADDIELVMIIIYITSFKESMMKRISLVSFLLLQFTALTAVGAPQCNIHTWHNIFAKDGEWKVTLKVINQNGFFVDSHCNPVETDFARINEPLTYGFGFSNDANFDIAYTITAIKQSQRGFQSPACVFVVSAKGPAQPDVSTLSYNGAFCEWKSVARAGGDIYLA